MKNVRQFLHIIERSINIKFIEYDRERKANINMCNEHTDFDRVALFILMQSGDVNILILMYEALSKGIMLMATAQTIPSWNLYRFNRDISCHYSCCTFVRWQSNKMIQIENNCYCYSSINALPHTIIKENVAFELVLCYHHQN